MHVQFVNAKVKVCDTYTDEEGIASCLSYY